MCPVGILTRVAKQLQYFATIIDGHTDGICPVGILPRVANKLQPMPQSLTRFPMKSPTDSANSNVCDCQTARSVGTFTDGITNESGKSNAHVL
jgi:hypothetical protein